jgi:predicted dithiol-disulfide oxidoreductase (DUF899 family)
MKYAEGKQRVDGYRKEIMALREKMRAARDAIEPAQVEDYQLADGSGPVTLSQLFGDKSELIVIHNMGNSCAYCTLWADGYNGVADHLANRAAFVVVSPDAPETQKKFADSRGWTFRMASHGGGAFAADMGYKSQKGGWLPGVSVFRKEDGKIVRVSDTQLGPYDDFCNVWHLFDLLPGGAAGWVPKVTYG